MKSYSLPRYATFALVFVQFSSTEVNNNAKNLPDDECDLSPIEYIRFHGYHAELHEIVTSDGYILGTHRVRSPLHLKKKNLQPIILLHGNMLVSMQWLVASPHGGTIRTKEVNYDTGETKIKVELSPNLGFVLADQGYDVWLPNFRGNVYSTKHVKLNPFKDNKFWDFSFEEISLKDTPAIIDYVQIETKADEVACIAHSQGTINILWLLAEFPQYSNIVNPVILLSPVIDLEGSRSSLQLLDSPSFKSVLKKVKGPWMSRSVFMNELSTKFCSERGLTRLCVNLLKFYGSFDTPQLNYSRFGAIQCRFPGGASYKVLAHHYQAADDKEIRYIDRGIVGNILRYGKLKSPRVPWERINSTTMAVFVSSADVFGSEESIRALNRSLSVPLHEYYEVPYDLYSHIDFAFGIQNGRLLFPKILQILADYYAKSI